MADDATSGRPTRRTLVQGIGVLAGTSVIALPSVLADTATATPTTASPAGGAPPVSSGGVTTDDTFVVTPGLTYLNIPFTDFRTLTGSATAYTGTGMYAPGNDTDFVGAVPLPSGAVLKEFAVAARNSSLTTHDFTLARLPFGSVIGSTLATLPLTAGGTSSRIVTTTLNLVVSGEAGYAVVAPTTGDAKVTITGARIGYEPPPAAGSFVPLNVPVRVYDSRPAGLPAGGVKGKFANHEERVIDAKLGTGVPAGASSVLVNLAATNTNPGGFFSLFKNGVVWPNTSTLNWGVANTTVASLASTQLAANGTFRARCEGAGGADLVVDVVGYFI